jgi:hypothetical protein
MRIVMLACCLVLNLSAASAWAQVAVPSLLPVSPTFAAASGAAVAGITTINPAALQWSRNSVVAAGAVRADYLIEDGGEDLELEASFGGLRWVGDLAGFAVESASIRSVNGDGVDTLQEAAVMTLSMAAGDGLTLGAAGGRRKDELNVESAFSPAPGNYGFRTEALDTTSVSAGLGIRFGTWFYLGAAAGRDVLTGDVNNGLVLGGVTLLQNPVEVDEDRPYQIYGVGIRSNGAFQVHLETYAINRESYQFGDESYGGVQTSAVVLEFAYANVALGLRSLAVDEEGIGGGDKTKAVSVAHLAWAPPQSGLTVGLHWEVSQETEELDDPAKDEQQVEVRVTGASVGYVF